MLNINKISTSIIVMLLAMLSAPQAVQAGVIGTPGLMPQALMTQDLAQSRQTIRDQLVELGVSADEAAARVARLSDQQITEIDAKLAELPAGADVGGILLTLFIVFVITDVIGATDIFPFIEPVK